MQSPKLFMNNYLKPLIRFFWYPHSRKKFFKEISIAKKQNICIKNKFSKSTKKIIIFFVPGALLDTGIDNISGGVLSIASLYEETKKLEKIHQSKCLMCTFPLEYLLLKHTRFENDITVYRLDLILKYFTDIEDLIIHIPEIFVHEFEIRLNKFEKYSLNKISNLHINILNQNIRLMPSKNEIDILRKYSKNITITTAHSKYSTLFFRNLYGVPLHFFSTFASPENYINTSYKQKKNLLLLSPDNAIKNSEIIQIIAQKLPHIKTQVIQNLKYDEYKELICEAKWCLTFGEGLDFYFIEPVFSGGVGFAIYNEQFFTSDFKAINTIYNDYDKVIQNIVDDILYLDNEESYNALQQQQFNLCSKYYSYKNYKKNIELFYQGDYTFK
jgi:hypothetical protein